MGDLRAAACMPGIPHDPFQCTHVGVTVANVARQTHEPHRTGGRQELVTTCSGGGQGIAAILERA